MIINNLYRLSLFILLLFITHSAHAQTAIQLFNQKDLEGWHAYEPETDIVLLKFV